MSDDIKTVKAQILQRLNIRQEYEQMGVKFVGHPNKRGWNPCFNPYKSEQHPSCGINTVDESRLGQLVAFNINNGGGAVWCKSIFDVASDFVPGLGGEFIAALRYYAAKTGIELHGSAGAGNHKSKEIDRQYDYCDAAGALQYQVIRYKGRKNFMPRRPDPLHPSRWIYDLPENMRLPYGLNKVAAADTIYIVEGEKDCQTLEALGLCASTNPFGAGKWVDAYNQHFAAKHIIILYDNDEPGKAHAQLVARNLQPVAASVRIVDLPGCEKKEDITDWLNHEHTLEELQQLVQSPTAAPPIEAPPADPLDAHIDKFNETHAVVMLNGKFLILTETRDAITNQPDIELSGVQDFLNYYSNNKIYDPVAGKRQSAGRMWIEFPRRREYKKIIFDPGLPQSIPGEYYNLYRGLAIQPKQGDWSLFRNHIQQIICSGDETLFQWVLAWIARIVQDPGGKRPGTSIVMRGKQGAGKGCFVSIFGELFGQNFLHITNQNQLSGRFNNHLKDALVVYCDEGFWAGDKASEGALKGMVTEKSIIVEPKGRDAFAVKNFINLIISSNHEWVVPAGLEERRFCVIDVSDDKMQDHDYFNPIYKQMDRKTGIPAMLYDLLNMNISNIDLMKIPITNALIDQKYHLFQSVDNFWYERLLEGSLFKEPSLDDWPSVAIISDLYDEYIAYCSKMSNHRPVNRTHFSRNIIKFCPGITVKISKISGKSRRQFVIPSIDICRFEFDKVMGVDGKWLSEEDEALEFI